MQYEVTFVVYSITGLTLKQDAKLNVLSRS
jgi:hypothetical protein